MSILFGMTTATPMEELCAEKSRTEKNSVYERIKANQEVVRANRTSLLDKIESARSTPMKAAVGFDATSQKFVVVDDFKSDEEPEEGAMVDYDGQSVTILQLCEDVDEARTVCEEKATDLTKINGLGLTHIQYDEDPKFSTEDTLEDNEEAELNSVGDEAATTAHGSSGNDEDSVDDGGFQPTDQQPMNSVMDLLCGFQQQLDEGQQTVRDLIAFYVNEIQTDIDRVAQKQEAFRKFVADRFGSEADGRLLAPLFKPGRARLFDVGSTTTSRTLSKLDKQMNSHFDDMERLSRKRINPLLNSKGNGAKKKRVDDDEYDDGFEEVTERQTVGNGIGRAGGVLTYPFISREREVTVHRESNGSASIYAQKLGLEVFADSLDLYFKDQCPKRRNWIHEAVDFRFPSEDKQQQLHKWKNCSYAINKNMRLAQTPQPNRTDRSEKVKELRDRDAPVSAFGIQFKYSSVSQEFERECFNKCSRDPHKYAELMALRLFGDSLDLLFKDQDQKRKDWLRDCVDRRFPMPEEFKHKRDQRWKVCAAACNRNRTKVLGDDGREAEFPYFSKDQEEDCYRKSSGVAYVYAELMNKLLFPDTPQLLFKDQEIGKRNWLHRILDKRFPTTDRAEHTAKWKSCTSAINKNMTNPFASTPPIPSNTSFKMPTSATATPKEPPVRFERRSATERARDDDRSDTISSSAASGRGTPLVNGNRANGATRRSEDTQSLPKRESARLSNQQKRKEKHSDTFTAYPFVSEEDELEILERANGNAQVYARELAKLLFKETLKLYYKDQDPPRRQWMREIVDFRFPSKSSMEHKQKWKNVSAAINRNMVSATSSSSNGRRSSAR